MTENAPNPKPAGEPEIVVVNGTPTTTSQAIADLFGKRHDNVLRAIDEHRAQIESAMNERLLRSEETLQDHLRNFEETVIERPNPAGGDPIRSRGFRLTQSGFTLLAMGFNGNKALQFKLAYIDAFDRMAQQLAPQTAGQGGALPPTDQPRRRARRPLALPAPTRALSEDLQSVVDERAWVITAGCMDKIRAWLSDEVRRNCIDDMGHVKPNLANTLAAATFEDFASDWEAQRVNVQLGLLDFVVRELMQVRRGLRSRRRKVSRYC